MPADKRRVKLPEELLDAPETARALGHIAKSVQSNRQKRQQARAELKKVVRAQFSEYDLDKLTQMADDDPGLLMYLQQRGELAQLTFAIMLSRRELQRRAGRGPWEPSQADIADLVDRVAEGISGKGATTKARDRVATWLDKSLGSVTKTHKTTRRR